MFKSNNIELGKPLNFNDRCQIFGIGEYILLGCLLGFLGLVMNFTVSFFLGGKFDDPQ